MTKQVASLNKPLHLDALLSCVLKSAASRTPEAYERLVVESIMTDDLNRASCKQGDIKWPEERPPQ